MDDVEDDGDYRAERERVEEEGGVSMPPAMF
jgi:hypothetical protein